MTYNQSLYFQAITTARQWIEHKNLLIIDTESTGLDDDAQIVEIAVVDLDGRDILNTLIKPTCEISPQAAAVHGITPEQVANAPLFSDLWPFLSALFRNRLLLSYGAGFDFRLLRQSAQAAGSITREDDPGWQIGCIMQAYADFYGQWSDYFQSNKFQKLTAAADQLGIHLEGKAHGALYDAQLARLVLLHISATRLPEAQSQTVDNDDDVIPY